MGSPITAIGKKWREGKVRPVPGNSPHDRPGKPGDFFLVLENLRRSLLHHSFSATATNNTEAPSMRF
jgi:hypothetical protein